MDILLGSVQQVVILNIGILEVIPEVIGVIFLALPVALNSIGVVVVRDSRRGCRSGSSNNSSRMLGALALSHAARVIFVAREHTH